MIPIRLFIFLLVCFSSAVNCQRPDFTYIGVKEGLNGNSQWSVNAVAKDKKGFVWFITMGGLNRWDGYAIQSYSKVSTDEKDLPNNQLSAIAVDKNDNIWLGTQEEGIIFFDTKKETFKAIDFTKISKNGISFSQINRLTVDDTNTLYILAGFQGLFKYEIYQNKFETYTKLNSKIGGSVSDMIFTKNGKVIVAATNGFFHLHSKDLFDFYEKPYEYFVRTMVELPDEQFYVFIQNVEKHYILNLKEKTLKLLPNTLPHLAINGLVDQENNFWVSFMDGILSKQNLDSKKIEQYTLFTKLYNHEVTIGLLSMYNSPDQKTYFMSIGSGAGIMDRSKKMIQPFLSKEFTNLKIIDDEYYCTKASSLYKIKDGAFKKLAQLEAKFNDQYIMNYYISKDHGIYISHMGSRGGLSHFDITGKPTKPGETMNCGTMYTQVEKDSLCWERKSMKAYPLTYPIKFIGQYYTDLSHEEIPDFKVKHYNVFRNGEIWMATFKDGVIRVYDNRKKYQNYTFENKKLNSNNAYYVFGYSNGDVYIITDFGINIWHAQTDQFTYHLFPENRSSNYVFGMIEDSQHRIWMLQSEKFLCYDPSKDVFYSMPIPDQYKVEVDNELQIDKNGNLYYQGHNGIFTFHPNNFFAGNEPSSVLITDLYVKRNRVYPGDQYKILDSSIINQNYVEVPFKYRDLGFGFVSLNGKDCDAVYYYRLKGYNNEWLSTKDERTIHFTNIDPGKYTFEVKALAGNGKASKISIISIRVEPPWYQRWYAYLLYFVSLSSIMYGVFRYRINQIMRYHNLRTKISSDLHDDVGSILSGIAMQTEMMSYDQKNDDTSILKELSHMSRDAMERMRDIVWALDSRKDKYENLIDRMRAFAEYQLPLKNINHIFNADEIKGELAIAPDVRQNVYLIFKEAITNITKHANADHVNISFSHDKGRNLLIIHDNGPIHNATKTDGSGLSNMRQRAANIGATISIDSSNGYRVELVF